MEEEEKKREINGMLLGFAEWLSRPKNQLILSFLVLFLVFAAFTSFFPPTQEQQPPQQLEPDYSDALNKIRPEINCTKMQGNTYFCRATANDITTYLQVDCYLIESNLYCGNGRTYELIGPTLKEGGTPMV